MKKTSLRRTRFGRFLSFCTSMLLIASLVSPAAAVVFTNPAAITINDAVAIGIANPYSSNISVSGLTGNITNITVSLRNINSTFPDDYDILLVGPTGANIILMSDCGGSDDRNNVDITFDDASPNSLPDGTLLPSGGTFKPTNFVAGDTWPAPAPAPSANTTLAAAFVGTAPNGTWSLFVVDDLGADMGFIGNGWGLTITTASSPATAFNNSAPILGGDGVRGRASAYSSNITASGLTGAVTDVNVTLTGLNHLNPDDIDILLVSPAGKKILLLSDAGGTTDVVSANLTFDDAAAAGIPDAGPMVTATVRPTNFGTGDTIPDVPPIYPNSATAGGATLASAFNGTEPNGTWRLYIVDDATTSAGSLASGWSIDITAGGSFGASRFTNADFDADGRTDTALYKPSNNRWHLRDSSSYQTRTLHWGAASDIPVPGDYDGDRATDLAVYRPSAGQWIVFNSATSTMTFTPWGIASDTPIPADYDGDGKTDCSVRRGGDWYILQSATSSLRAINWGLSTDVPVMGHFGGTNGADFAVFRPSDTTWYILNNAGSSFQAVPWGLATDELVPGDYDGDGRTDIAVWRPTDGNWYILRSSDTSLAAFHNGMVGDTPVPGDYDGDTMTDVAVWRGVAGGGAWYIYNTGTPVGAAALKTDNYGDSGDIPIANMYLP
jgi:subtilisin-like proprotein convertase family protein